MIYCVTQPLAKYGHVTDDGIEVGLCYSYHGKLLNLVTRASLVPFQYEQGSLVPLLSRLGAIDGIEAFEKSLDISVGGHKLRILLNSDPLTCMEFLCKQSLGHLPLAGYWKGQDALKFVLQARAYQWAKRKQEGNVYRLHPKKLDEVQEEIIKAARN